MFFSKLSSLLVDLDRVIFGDSARTTKRCSRANRARLGQENKLGEGHEGLRYPRDTFSSSPRIRRPVGGKVAARGLGSASGIKRETKSRLCNRGMKYEVAAMGGMGRGGNSRAAPDNRVIFTRDLGGDFARKENAVSLFRRAVFLFSLSFQPSHSLENLPFYLRREIRPVEAISMQQRVCYFLPVCYSEAARRRNKQLPLYACRPSGITYVRIPMLHALHVAFEYAIQELPNFDKYTLINFLCMINV